MTSKNFSGAGLLILCSILIIASCKKDIQTASDDQLTSMAMAANKPPEASRELFASGFNDPRGLTFGPDGNLYVAEAGVGGTLTSTSISGCTDQAPAPFGPYYGSTTGGRISRVNTQGDRTTVTDQLPTAVSSIGDILGPADVAFLGHQLYVLVNAGCSHGVDGMPSGVYRIDGSTPVLVGDLSAWQRANPVAAPEDEDFEPDGSWYNLEAAGNALYALDANHGELVKVNTNGSMSRLVDFSAHFGHVVPTGMDYRGNFFVGNLDVFPVMGQSSLWRVNMSGKVDEIATGFNAIVGVVADGAWTYVLEMMTEMFIPGTGRIVAVSPKGEKSVILDGLQFPTAMTKGPDGNLYVANWGFGKPPGGGEVLKVTLHKK